MDLLTQAPELFLLLPESNRVHVRQIQSMQMATSGADTGDQSNQDDRVSGPLGVSFHRGAVDEDSARGICGQVKSSESACCAACYTIGFARVAHLTGQLIRISS
jgi:hypothetical protein